ncbi:preprotein translocase subunit SecG [Pelagibacterium montanilacus]|uniref:preprotein translocase subunit SecG n=1 Tax=Pelagibacterium montanilacus TaxID=2185280 RepID=UPI000F8C5B5D|nr:preprotein translocase subunit SecG [Pelagibacterium montanilacus]
MATVLIVAYLLIVVAMIVVILLQRSEGGGLGMGGGGGGNFMSARGSANLLTRTTAILGTLFMLTAIALTVVSQLERTSTSILDSAVEGDGTPGSVLDALDSMGTSNDDLVVPPAEGIEAPADDVQAPATEVEAPAEAAPAQDVDAPAADAQDIEAPAADVEAPASGAPADLAVPEPQSTPGS